MPSDILAELSWRGLIHQSTDLAHLRPWLADQTRTLYVGFDPTADSLHVGSLLPVMILRRFQRCGHRPIALVGGATGMIGDPSGKSEERNLLDLEKLRANVEGMQRQIARFLDFDHPTCSARLVNNYDWMSPFSYLEFLRDVGKHFPVNVMLTKDSVRSRLERESVTRNSATCCSRPTTSYTCTGNSAANYRSAAATSGATSRPASTWLGA